MLHLYDSSSYSTESQETRLKAACALSKAHIKTLMWGEDALAFIHFVPANLYALHLVVADQDLRLACAEVIKLLPYGVFTGVDKHYVEHIWLDPDQPRTYPHSVYFQLTTPLDKRSIDDPEMIFLHPQSQFYLDVRDNRSHSHLFPIISDSQHAPHFSTP